MSIADEIAKLHEHPKLADKAFRDQLKFEKDVRGRLAAQVGEKTPAQGIDRSRDLLPVERPSMVRTSVFLARD